MGVHRTASSCRKPVVLLKYLTRVLPSVPSQELRERTRRRYLKCLLFFLTAKPSRASQGQRLSSGMESGVLSSWREAGLGRTHGPSALTLGARTVNGDHCAHAASTWAGVAAVVIGPSAAVGTGGERRPRPEVLPVKCPRRCPWRLQTVSGDKALMGDKPEGTGKAESQQAEAEAVEYRQNNNPCQTL